MSIDKVTMDIEELRGTRAGRTVRPEHAAHDGRVKINQKQRVNGDQ